MQAQRVTYGELWSCSLKLADGGQPVPISEPTSEPTSEPILELICALISSHFGCRIHVSPLCTAHKGLLWWGGPFGLCTSALHRTHQAQCSMQAHLVEVDRLEAIYDAGTVLHG